MSISKSSKTSEYQLKQALDKLSVPDCDKNCITNSYNTVNVNSSASSDASQEKTQVFPFYKGAATVFASIFVVALLLNSGNYLTNPQTESVNNLVGDFATNSTEYPSNDSTSLEALMADNIEQYFILSELDLDQQEWDNIL